MQNSTIQYATVWSRAVAFAIDFAIIRLIIIGLDKFSVRQISAFFTSQQINLNTNADAFAFSLWLLVALHFIVWIGYFVLFERSRLSASFGKLIFKIRVVDEKNNNPKLIVTFTRNVYKLLPIALYQCVGVTAVVAVHYNGGGNENIFATITNNIGIQTIPILLILGAICSYGLALFTKQKQALHDVMAHTIVMKTDENPLKQVYLQFIGFIKHLRKRDFSGN